LKSDVQFTDQYDTLDLSSFSECTTIANSAFICEGSTAKYVLNKQFFGSTAIYVSGSKNYFDGNGNLSIVHNQSLDGPIKYLFLPDSLITIGERAFRLAYSFDSLLIFPKNLTFLPGYCLNFIGFTSIWINENYASQPINTYSVIFSPFLLCMGMDHNNSAFTFYYHYDKSNVANG
jgi:hypothetical protein